MVLASSVPVADSTTLCMHAGCVVGGGVHPGAVGVVLQFVESFLQAPSENAKANPPVRANVLRTACMFTPLLPSRTVARRCHCPLQTECQRRRSAHRAGNSAA